MSHIVQIQTEVRDPIAAAAACERLGLPQPIHSTYELFNNQATGLGVQLPEWQYPVVCDLRTGKLNYDNYGGHWGEQVHLDKFLQAYAVERVRIEARLKGHTATEQTLADGSIKVTIQLGSTN